MALPSISSLSAPSFVRWSTVALVIFVPASVICTCMGPYCVFATVPVTMRVDAWPLALPLLAAALAFLLALLAAGLAELDPAPLAIGCDVPADADGVLVASGAAAASECVLNESSAASPAA